LSSEASLCGQHESFGIVATSQQLALSIRKNGVRTTL